jgi:hypothetical protein
MRKTDSPDRTFHQLLSTLLRLRPNCLVLLRPHPISVHDPVFQRALNEFDDPRIVVSFAHPEALIAISRRVLVNGSGNIQTTSPSGLFIDCTDYAAEHYAEFGEVSLVDGYGSILVRPDLDGFDKRLAQALDDDSLFADQKVDRKRRALAEKSAFRIEMLLARLESQAESAPQEKTFR